MRRSHVEMRSRDTTPPRQCVSDDHSAKNPPRIREHTAMTIPLLPLAIALGLYSSFPSLEQ